jgi:hypothetical protein
MMTESLELFAKYKEQQFAAFGGYSDYDAEIGKRLGQLQWFLNRATTLQLEISESLKGGDLNLQVVATLGELEIMTECFYFYTGRLTELFKHNQSFGKIPKSSAEMIRHRLLQHPEKEGDHSKSVPLFSVGTTENGLIIKGYHGPDGAQDDAGLFVNAKEFDRKVAQVISMALT